MACDAPAQVEQGALTGESRAMTLRPGDVAKMGCTVLRGEAEALVVATGRMTARASSQRRARCWDHLAVNACRRDPWLR